MVRMRQNTARIGLLVSLAATASLVALLGCDNSRAHRSIGNLAMPVPIAGNAIDLREFSSARRSAFRVAARKFASDVDSPSLMLAA